VTYTNENSKESLNDSNEDLLDILDTSIDHNDIRENRRKSISKVLRLKKNLIGTIEHSNTIDVDRSFIG